MLPGLRSRGLFSWCFFKPPQRQACTDAARPKNAWSKASSVVSDEDVLTILEEQPHHVKAKISFPRSRRSLRSTRRSSKADLSGPETNLANEEHEGGHKQRPYNEGVEEYA